MKQFGPTSCSAKRSDLFLPKVRYVRKKRSSQHLQQKSCEKNEGAFGKKRRCVWKKTQGHLRENVFVFTPWCVRVRTLMRSPAFPRETNALAFALHLYRFSHGQSFFFSPKKFTGPEWGPK